MISPITRRDLLRSAAAGAAGLVILADSRSARSYQVNEKIDVALIGCGGRGSWFVDTIPKMENLVAMCDVNDERAAESYRKLPDVPKYQDYRKMLDDRGRHIDAVIIAAPDHSHAPATLLAIRLGKHVFCEKPLTRCIHEARIVRRTAAGSRVATQLGNQGTSSEAFRRCVELTQAGVIGDVREVIAWNEGGGSGRRDRPSAQVPVPATLQWDLWLGPAPARPFHPDWLAWHTWRDFGSGQLGNWASHTMNLPFKALRLDTLWDEKPAKPLAERLVRVKAEVEEVNTASFPRWEILTYSFPARGAMPPVELTWLNGHNVPRGREHIEDLIGRKLDWGDAGEKKWADYAGCLLVGTKGIIHSTGHNMTYTLLPEATFKGFEGPPPTLPRTSGQEAEWFQAIRGQAKAMSSFEYGARLAEFTMLGNIATLYPSGVEYDPVAEKVLSPREALPELRRPYRPGWGM